MNGLRGRRVVVTRAQAQAGGFAAELERRGAAVVLLPLIEIVDPPSWEPLDRALRRLAAGGYEWVAFASASSVARLTERARSIERATEGLERARVAAVGPATAAALRERGVRVDVVPERFTGAALASALGEGSGRVLVPRVLDAPPLDPGFSAAGRQVDEVVAYRNVRAARTSAHDTVEAGRFDAITFMSPSAVEAFVDAVAWRGLGLGAGDRAGRVVACIGPSSAAAARGRGLRVDVVPREHTGGALADALADLAGARR